MKIQSTIRALVLATAMTITGAGVATAADVSVCLHLNGGEKVFFSFRDHPVLTFEGNQMHITYKTDQVSAHDYTTVRKITFEDVSGVKEVTEGNGRISSRAGIVTLTGFAAGTAVSVVSVNGQVMLTDTIADGEPYCIDLSGYAKNVYIIRANAISYKVTN